MSATEEPTPTDRDDRRELGDRIRAVRRESGRTLEVVARAAGFSTSFLSQVERGLAEPSLSSLRALSAALDVPVAALFVSGDDEGESAPSLTERQMVVRRRQRKHLRVPQSSITYQLLVPNLNRKLELLWGEIGPGDVSPLEPEGHDGEEETILCVKGALVVEVEGVGYALDEGDSISFDPRRPHRMRQESGQPTEILVALTPPSF